MLPNVEEFKKTHIDHQKFRDMRLRIINARGCVFPPRRLVPVLNERPGERWPREVVPLRLGCPGPCWPYGVLYLYRNEDKELEQATFGDLTISVTFEEAGVLRDIATNPNSKFAYQW